MHIYLCKQIRALVFVLILAPANRQTFHENIAEKSLVENQGSQFVEQENVD